MKAAFIEQFGGPEVLKYGDLPDPVAGAGRGRRRYSSGERQRRRLESAQPANIRKPRFPWCWAAIFPAWSPRLARASMIWRSAMRCSASSKPAARAPTPKSLRSRPRSSPRSPTGCRTSTPPPWRSPGSRRSVAVETTLAAQARRDHPHSGRRRRRRELRHSACQASRRPCDHHHQRGEPGLCARPRRR